MGVWAGDDSPSKRDRQPSLFAYTLVAVSEAVVPLKRGNKKSVALPTGETAYCMSGTTTTGLLAYTSLQTLSTFNQEILRCGKVDTGAL